MVVSMVGMGERSLVRVGTVVYVCLIVSVALCAGLILRAGQALGQEPDPGGRAGMKKVVVGYLPDYRVAQWEPSAFFPVTDLIYFGVGAPSSSHIEENIVRQADLQKLAKIKKEHGCRIWLCIGGWEKSKGFAKLTEVPQERKKYVNNLVAYAVKHGFDGIDFDWEHPEGAEQTKNYVHLLREVKEEGKRHGLQVSIAIAAWMNLGSEGFAAVDRVHLMAYDHDFPQATVALTRADVKQTIANGCPASKIVLGVPFYGRNEKRVAKTYAEIVQEFPEQLDGDIVGGYALNGRSTIQQKMIDIRELKLGGIMIWELAQDSNSEETSLLRVIANSE